MAKKPISKNAFQEWGEDITKEYLPQYNRMGVKSSV